MNNNIKIIENNNDIWLLKTFIKSFILLLFYFIQLFNLQCY